MIACLHKHAPAHVPKQTGLASGTMAIQAQSVINVVELASGTQLDLASFLTLSFNGRFESNNATVRYHASDPASVLQIESGGVAEWKASRFEGNGSTVFAAGATIREVSTCSFGKGIELAFDENQTMIQKWRNNNVQNPNVDLNKARSDVRAYQCDASGTGNCCPHCNADMTNCALQVRNRAAIGGPRARM